MSFLKRLLPQNDFSRNVLVLMTGTSVAQAIPIAISPILTRIFTPEDFGLLALYSSIVLIFSSIVSGRYESAIIIPKDDIDAKNIVFLAVILSLISSVIMFLVIALFSRQLSTLLGSEEIRFWLYLIPLNIFIISVSIALRHYSNRNKKYKNISQSTMLQSVTQGGGNLLLGTLTQIKGALIMGVFIGNLFCLIFLYKVNLGIFSRNYFDIKKIKFLSKKYINFPKILVASTLIEGVSAQLPVFLLGSFFGPAIVGFYSLSQRTIRLPIGVVGDAFSQVFRQEALDLLNKKNDCSLLFKTTLKKLILIAALPFMLFFIFAPDVFSIVFGANWRVAGEYAQILTPLFFLQFVVSPLSIMIIVREKQAVDLKIQIYLFFSVLLSFVVGYHFFDSVIYCLKIFTLVYSLKYLYELYVSYSLTKVSRY